MTEENNDYKLLMIGILVIGAIFVILGLLVHPNKLAWTKGLVFGTVFTALKFALMKRALVKTLEMDEHRAGKYAMGQYVIRYLITGVVLIAAALEPSIDFVGVCVGLITLKISTYALLALGRINK